MIRILQVSDVHLGAPLSGFGEQAAERRRAVRAAFRALPGLADRLAIQAVVVAGDLFDGQLPDRADVDLAREVLRGLSDGGSRGVFAIPGNHDRCSTADSPWHAMPEEIEVILAPRFGPPRTFEVGDTTLHVYGVAYDPVAEPDPLAGYRRAGADGVHVVLLHAGMSDNPGWHGGHGLRTTSESVAALDADYVALGDYHTCRLPSEFAGGRACYAGSFAAVRATETGPHGVVVVELGTGGLPAATLVPSSVPMLIDPGPIDVSDVASDLEAAETVGARVAKESVASDGELHPVVRLVGEPGVPLDGGRIRAALTERFGFAVVSDETRFISSARVHALCEQPTVAGHVARLGLERADDSEQGEQREIAEHALRIALRALEEA
ncbi:MAG: exonuclease SbcCD subunit D [Gemmatimonadota bacterium]